MPKYYISHPEFDIVVDATTKREACKKVCEMYEPDINKCEFVFINETGFSSQFSTESAVSIRDTVIDND